MILPPPQPSPASGCHGGGRDPRQREGAGRHMTQIGRTSTVPYLAPGQRDAGEGRVEVRHVDHIIAAELFLGLREGPVQHLGLAVGDAHRGRRRGRPQPVGRDRYLGVAQRLAIGHVGVDDFIRLLGPGTLGRPLVAIDQQHVLHCYHSSVIERPSTGRPTE